MNIVNYIEYDSDKVNFLKGKDFSVKTTNFDNGRYYREYICNDGSIFYEVASKVYEKVNVEVKKVNMEILVELFEVEYWTSLNGTSKYYYEKY